MNRVMRALRWCVATLVLAACTAPPTAPPAVAPTAPPAVPQIAIPEDVNQLSELVAYYGRVAAMRPEDQRREYAGASQTFSRDPTPYNRMRVALLTLMPGTPFQDDARAMSLLEPYARAGPSSGKLRQLAVILHGQLAEGAAARARAEQLKEQLDALRAVERTIIERAQPAPPAKQ